jgi:tetratricopeptide (TPR) repeat protein/transcriptional regulator with XRE-family HTH domain
VNGIWFGNLVRSARHEAGLTQEQLAEISGVSVRAIVDLERGQVGRPRSDTVQRIAAACGLSGPALANFQRAARAGTAPLPAGQQPSRPPAQLPPALAILSARAGEQAVLDELLSRANAGRGGPTIAVLFGTAGVGKTALAVHWAHRVLDRFPDGQLYVNLRGFEPAGEPRSPDDAVRAFLDGFEVPPAQIPADLDARVARYRSLIAGRRMLVVLDNARDAAQVRPLLPGSASAFVVVTSRDRLAGLVAGQAAVPVPVSLLDREGARAVLIDRLGADSVAGETGAVEELTTRTAGLPLALAVVAARAAGLGAASPLTTVVGELRLAERSLDPLAGTDPATDVRTVLASSYRALQPGAARLFRLLALHPAGDFDRAVLDSLSGGSAGPALAELVDACLVAPVPGGRYSRHDLLRVYAVELAADDSGEIAAARQRMLDHFLHTAHRADRLVIPSRDPIPLDPPAPGTVIGSIEDRDAAVAWFAAERAVLVAAVNAAVDAGLDRRAWQLAWSILEYLDRWGHWADAAATHQTALIAADRLADPVAQAFTHRGLGRAYGRLGRQDEARDHLQRAVELFTSLGSAPGAARTHLSLAGLAERGGDYDTAVHHASQALQLFRQAGRPIGVGNALNTLAWYHTFAGDHANALTRHREALSILEPTGDRYGLASTWEGLGAAYHGLGAHTEAIACFRRAIQRYRTNGDRYGEVDALSRLADAYAAVGDSTAARRAREVAARIESQPDAS